MKNFKRMIAVIMVAIAAVSWFAIPASSENGRDINSEIGENAVVFYAEA